MISNTTLKKRNRRKNNPELVETLHNAKKHNAWRRIAQKISSSRRNYSSVNLATIQTQTKEGDTVVIVGKVLGSGNLDKKVRVCALQFSETAREKLQAVNAEIVPLNEEIEKNPKAEGITVLA